MTLLPRTLDPIRTARRRRIAPAAAFACAVAAASGLAGQASGARPDGAPPDVGRVDPARAVPGDTVSVVPSRSYLAGGFHRFLLGSGYRDLWATPIRVRVLDLDTYAGGLEPMERGGGAQTQSLRMRGADGRTYLFRSVDKDATRSLDPLIRQSLVADILQDRIAHLLPSSALVVDPILDAAGVLHAVPGMYVMPDDPRLGEFRDAFAGLLGLVEVRPNEADEGAGGFAGSPRIVGSESFLDRIEDDQDDVIDAREYLRARLLDVLVGDWDRHPDQWRWAAFDSAGTRRWVPIPRDRDWALSRLDGMMALAVAGIWPHYVGFRPGFPSAWRATWSARKLDRQLLSGLDRAAWREVTADLQRRLTDQVIERAVGAMPAPHRERVGDYIGRALRARRDALDDFAADYYALLAAETDVYATDQEELAEARVLADGSVRLTLSPSSGQGEADGPAFFDRTFVPDETDEVRVYLRGDDDWFVASGAGPSPITVRVIGGGGDDHFEDRSAAAVARFYDDRGDNVGEGIDDRPYERPLDLASPSHWAFARDWGTLTARAPVAEIDGDNGLVLGGTVSWLRYGFRKHPYARRLTLTAAVGTFTGLPSTRLEYELHDISPALSFLADAGISGLERDHFYGFGNETPGQPDTALAPAGSDGGEEFFRAERWDARTGARLRWQQGPRLFAEAGPFVRFTSDRNEQSRIIGIQMPYGAGDFAEAGLQARIAWDGRDDPAYPTRGASLSVDARVVPAWLDVTELFGGGGAEARGYVTTRAPFEATLGARVRGEVVRGTVPYHEAVYIGGRKTVRGLHSDRFAGDGSLVATAELRVPVAHFSALMPGEIGLLGLADVGRVWFEDEQSGRWHGAAGGGVWLGFLERKAVLSAYVARGDDRTAVYVGHAVTF